MVALVVTAAVVAVMKLRPSKLPELCGRKSKANPAASASTKPATKNP